MRIRDSIILPVIISSAVALPFENQVRDAEPVIRRKATWSVVQVDGGGAYATSTAIATVTTDATATVTAKPTKLIVSTHNVSLPGSTITVTKDISEPCSFCPEGHKSYSIVNPEATETSAPCSTTTVVKGKAPETYSKPTSTSSKTSTHSSKSSHPVQTHPKKPHHPPPSVPAPVQETPCTTSESYTTQLPSVVSYPTGFSSYSSSSTTCTTSSLTTYSSAHTYDNGLWHTSYPPWTWTNHYASPTQVHPGQYTPDAKE